MYTHDDYAWLENTWWYVPDPGLPAMQFTTDDNTLAWQIDQTVWHITRYQRGYFWGASAALIYPAEEADTHGAKHDVTQTSLIGTLLPNGQVQISFIRSGRLRESITTGFGHLLLQGEKPEFRMQMSTGANGRQVLHWANMQLIKTTDADWRQLPGTTLSVPEMMQGAPYPTLARAQQ